MRASFFFLTVALSAFIAVQVANATFADQCQQRRDTCGDLVKKHHHGSGESGDDSGDSGDSGDNSGEGGKSPSTVGSSSSAAPVTTGSPSSTVVTTTRCVSVSSLAPSSLETEESSASSVASSSASSVSETSPASSLASESSSDASSAAVSSSATSEASSSAASESTTSESSSTVTIVSEASTDYSECPEGTVAVTVTEYSVSPASESASSVSLVSESVSSVSPGSGDLSDCELTDALKNMSVLLTGEAYEAFLELIYEIQITIDLSLSSDEIVVLCAYKLKAFFEVYVEAEAILQYQEIGSWGYVIDFVYVAYQIQIEITSTIVTLDSSNDCPLFDALRNASQGDSEKEEVCEELIANITVILQTSSWTYTQQQAQIYLLFEQLIEEDSSWQSFFYSIEIEGYGLVQYYIDVAFWYYQITIVDVAVSGEADQCAVAVGLNEAWQNTSYSLSVRSQLKQLYNKTVVAFSESTEISVRIEDFVEICFEQVELSYYMEIYFGPVTCGSWGTIYDLIFISNICAIEGCGNIGCGPGTTPAASSTPELSTSASSTSESSTTEASTTEASTTEASTTEASTTEASTTEASTSQPTTEGPDANCTVRWPIVAAYSFNSTTKSSHFMEAVLEAYNTWNATTKAGFNTYKNKLSNAIYNTTATHPQIFTEVISICQSYNANNAVKQAVLYDVFIKLWGGTIRAFVACGSSCGCS